MIYEYVNSSCFPFHFLQLFLVFMGILRKSFLFKKYLYCNSDSQIFTIGTYLYNILLLSKIFLTKFYYYRNITYKKCCCYRNLFYKKFFCNRNISVENFFVIENFLSSTICLLLKPFHRKFFCYHNLSIYR